MILRAVTRRRSTGFDRDMGARVVILLHARSDGRHLEQHEEVASIKNAALWTAQSTIARQEFAQEGGS